MNANGPLALLIVCAICTAACTPSPPENADAGSSAAIATTPVLLPDLSSSEPSVRKQIQDRYAVATSSAASSAADRALAFGELGKLLLAAQYVDASESSFLNAKALSPGDGRWSYYLGHVYRLRGNLPQAISSFEASLARQPGDAATLEWLGEVALEAGDVGRAEPALRKALELRPDSAAAAAALGRAGVARGDHAAAVKLLERALELDPEASTLHYPLSISYRRLGDAGKADQHLRQRGTVEVRRRDPLLEQLAGILESALAYDASAREALARGDWDAALVHARHGLELAGDNPAIRAALHHRLGTALSQTGDSASARREFEQAVQEHPTFAPGHYSLGVMLMSAGRPRDAIARFADAVRVAPNYVEARIALGDALRLAGRPEEAVGEYRRAAETAPANPAAQFGEAVALARLQRYREARDRLTRAVETHPGNAALALALVRVLAAAPDDAVRDGARAFALAQSVFTNAPTIDAAEAVAMAWAELGNFEDAAGLQREAMTTALRMGRDDIVQRLTRTLRLYEKKEPSRVPWPGEPLYGAPGP